LVSIHLKENFSFTVFPVACKVERLRMEEAIIATLNADPMFRPSSRWLGLFSPEEAIRESGLWLKRGLNGAPLTKAEFERLIELCGQQKRFAITVAHDSATNQAFATDVPVRSCGKYTPLFDFLNRQTAGQIILTFSEMESILGFKLPNSAYNNPAWWISKGHSYCQAWLQAGFDITNVADSLCTKIITFTRIE